MAQGEHPALEVLHMFAQQQLTAQKTVFALDADTFRKNEL